MKILIDNGHGVDTAGKRSPDGLFREFAFCREIAKRVVTALREAGYDAERIVTEETDISLKERCQRVNAICKKLGSKNVLLVSVHVNAAGSGVWLKAGGWSVYTSKGVTRADALATSLCEAAQVHLKGYTQRLEAGKKTGKYDSKQSPYRFDYSDGDPDQEAGFYILNNTACPAVLTENLFMDNHEDVAFLTSEEGKRAITELHVTGIKNFIKK